MKRIPVVALLALFGGCDPQPEAAPADARPADASEAKASLVGSPSSHEFGLVATGTMSPAASFSVSNLGKASSGPLVVQASGDFTADAGDCTRALEPGQSCSFTVTFSPSVIGERIAAVIVSDGVVPPVSFNLRGKGTSPDQIGLSNPVHDFGTLVIGDPSPKFVFEVRNHAPITTGPISVEINGADASAFSYTTTCTTLATNDACTVEVTAATTSAGTKAANLMVRGMPGGVATASLASKLLTPAALSIATDPAFGDVVLTHYVDRTFVVTNNGTQASGAVAISLSPGDFVLQPQALGDCFNGSTTLASGASCNVRVRFQPSAAGSKSATLSVSASPGGNATTTLTGSGLTQGALASDVMSHDFDATEVQFVSPTEFIWTIRNTGQSETGIPSLSNNDASEFIVWGNTCTSALPAGGTCEVKLKFRPLDGGINQGSVMVSASPGGNVLLSVKGEGLWRLTMTTAGTGTGTISWNGTACNGPNCTALFSEGATVNVSARSTNGTGSQFDRWSGNCVGLVNDCAVTMNGLRNVTATFIPVVNNIAFESSVQYGADLGGVAAYDGKCNALATAAGINNAEGTAFKAWISDDTSSAVTRLGANVGGWRLLDRRVVARSMNDLVNNRVLNPISVTEKGLSAIQNIAWTATNPDGTAAAANCSNWSTTTGTGQVGFVGEGPGRWTSGAANNCTFSRRVYCLQTTSTAAIAEELPPPEAKIIYYTEGFTPGGGVASANAYCNAHKPAIYSTRTFRALIASSTQKISTIAGPSTSYYRPDGTFVSTGSGLAIGSLSSGIWQRDDGTYPGELVRAWSGSPSAQSYGSVTSSCNDWTYNDPGARGQEGLVNRTDSISWWAVTPTIGCHQSRALYCIEQ